MPEPIYLYGAGSISTIVAEIVEAMGYRIKARFDDDPDREQGDTACEVRPGIRLVGRDSFPRLDAPCIISIGINCVRRELAGILPATYARAVHPSVLVSPSATIGEGTIVLHGSIIQANTVIGRHVLVNTAASIDHHCRIDDFAHISPHATVCGQVHVGEGSHIGAGATVIHCRKIGKWCTIGAGAVVIRDVPDNTTVIGNPARVLRADGAPERSGDA